MQICGASGGDGRRGGRSRRRGGCREARWARRCRCGEARGRRGRRCEAARQLQAPPRAARPPARRFRPWLRDAAGSPPDPPRCAPLPLRRAAATATTGSTSASTRSFPLRRAAASSPAGPAATSAGSAAPGWRWE
ncbi:hypothetical protein ACP4OV_027594 [Aristida adscensionis]